jgi:hypothetical protein
VPVVVLLRPVHTTNRVRSREDPSEDVEKTLRFQSSQASKYGLQETARDPATSAVTSIVCRFCVVFGRKERSGARRKATGHCKYFDHFRTDNYKQYLTQQHPTQWCAYDALTTPSEKEEFLKAVRVPFTATLDAHCESSGVLRFIINKSIVESIIGGLLFHPDDVEGLTHDRALSLFRPNKPEYGGARLLQCSVEVIPCGIFIFRMPCTFPAIG